MERFGVLLVLAFTLRSVAAQQLTSSGSVEADVGGTAQFECRVTGLSYISQQVKWAKVDNADPRVTKEISSHINVIYQPDHYSVKASQVDGDFVYTFTIKDIRKSDDGAYKCFVEEEGNIVTDTKETLTVRQPVSSLELLVGPYTISPDKGLEEFELDKFDPNLVIGCRVRGSNPAPKVMVKVGEDDVSSHLRREDQLEPIGNTLESIRAYSTDLDSTGVYPIDASVIGKEISCSAWMEGDEANKVVAKALLTVREPPKVECRNVTTRLGNRRVVIDCTITSLTPPEKISWFVDNENPMFVPATDTQVEEYRAKQKEAGEHEVKVSLEIGVVAEKHFDTIYELRAKVSQEALTFPVRIYLSGSTGAQGRVTMATTVLASVIVAGGLLKRLM